MITHDDQEYLVSGDFIEDGSMEREDKLRSIADRFQLNSQIRADQADTISRFVAASPYRVIVCGDFNDVPVSNTYRRMSHRLRDAFREEGRGYSYTYRGFFDMLRIDYILCSKDFSVLSYDVIDTWGLELQKRRAGDTIVVRTYGNKMPIMGDGVREKLDATTIKMYEGDSAVDNRVKYSDHYPVFVRLRYDGINN